MRDEGFAKRFKQAVEHAGVEDTQEALGKLLGVSGVTVWSYRNGEKLPRIKKASEIAIKLGVNVNWLMTGDGLMTESASDLTPREKLLLSLFGASTQQEQDIYIRMMQNGSAGEPASDTE